MGKLPEELHRSHTCWDPDPPRSAQNPDRGDAVIPGALIRYRVEYREMLPHRESEIYLVLDQMRLGSEQYLQVLGRGELLHFRFNSLFMYEEVE